MEIIDYHLMSLRNYGLIVKINQTKIGVLLMVMLNAYIQIVNLKVYLMNLIVIDRVI
jgi:hypothetical protein